MTTTDLERQTYFERMPVGRIHPDPINPRKNVTVDDNFLASIRAGIIEPLVVRPDPNAPALIDGMEGEFLIIAGHRRHLGATTIELDTVPARVIYDLEDVDVLEMMLVENQQRQNLTPLEEAEAYEKLVQLGRTQRDIAKHVGREQGTVSKRLSLLKLPERARVLLDRQTISVKTALGMTGLIKHNDRLARVLDFASMSADGDDRLIAQRVHRELESVQRDKERAKNPPPEPAAKNGAAPKLPIADDEERAHLGGGGDELEEVFLSEARFKANEARKSLIANLLGDGYPGDDAALWQVARVYATTYAEDQPDMLLAALGANPDDMDDNEMALIARTMISAAAPRAALAAALDDGERFGRDVRPVHLAFLQEHGYQLQLPEERTLFGDTVPDGLTEADVEVIDLTGDELADKNAEVNAAPASPDTEPSVVEVASTDPQSPDHQGDEATEGAATSAAITVHCFACSHAVTAATPDEAHDEMEEHYSAAHSKTIKSLGGVVPDAFLNSDRPPALPWKGYKGHTPKMITGILKNKDAAALADVILYEKANEQRTQIIDFAEGRLADMETDHQSRNGATK